MLGSLSLNYITEKQSPGGKGHLTIGEIRELDVEVLGQLADGTELFWGFTVKPQYTSLIVDDYSN